MASVFYVGELPTTPLVIELTGVPIDLSEYSGVALVGDTLPAGVVEVLDADANTIKYTQSVAFTVPGVFEVQAKLTRLDGRVDYSDKFSIEVRGATVASFVTTTEAWNITNKAASATALAEAQAFLAIVIKRDLADAEWRAGISDSDLARLKQGIAWQAVYVQPVENPEIPAGATSIKSGDVSITFGKAGQYKGRQISSLAILALTQLSWLRVSTIKAKPPTYGYDQDRFPYPGNKNVPHTPLYHEAWKSVSGGGW